MFGASYLFRSGLSDIY